MSLRGPIALTAALLFLIWLYFTIHQFWNALHMDTEPPIMMAYSIDNNKPKAKQSITHEPLPIPTNVPSLVPWFPTVNDAPTAQPSPILIEDKYLSEQDEIELTFEFDNDNHLYLYDVPYFAEDSIFIMSMVTNASELALSAQLQTLDEISCIFKDTYILIFESNSFDDTPQILRNWTMNRNNDSTQHNSFCDQYVFGFHRRRMHSFQQTGDYLNDLFAHNTSKAAHVHKISKHRKTNVLVKQVLFGDEHVIDEMEQFKNKIHTRFLSRIEKYSFYRNLLLHHMYDITKNNGFTFDYLMILDLDIFGFQQRLLLSELYYYHKLKRTNHNNGNVILCSHGTLAHNFYMDTFASVDTHHQWYYEYQRNATFVNVTDDYLTNFPRYRFERMRSCFGGVIIYSNVSNIIDSTCNYDLAWSQYDVPKAVEQVVVDRQYDEVTHFANKMRGWRSKKKSKVRRYKRRDNHICEHIPFHYCLYYTYNYSTAIAKYAYLFYEPVEMYRLDFNERLIEQTPSPTSETARERRKRERKAKMKRERDQRLAKARENSLEKYPEIGQYMKQIVGVSTGVEDEKQMMPIEKQNVRKVTLNAAETIQKGWWKVMFIILTLISCCVMVGCLILS
eukprot:60240_1